MKVAILSFILAVVIVSATVEGFEDQTRIMGTVRYGDQLLDQKYAIAGSVRGRNIIFHYKYPTWGWGKTISCIKVMDRWFNGTNGDLYLNSGGVGSRSVSMTIQSKLGYGINYIIEVWGR